MTPRVTLLGGQMEVREALCCRGGYVVAVIHGLITLPFPAVRWSSAEDDKDDDAKAAQANANADNDDSNQQPPQAAPPQDSSAQDDQPHTSGEAATDSGEWHKADPNQLPQDGANRESTAPKPPALNANPYSDPQQALKHWHKELQDLGQGDEAAPQADQDMEEDGGPTDQPNDAMDYTADDGGEALLLAPVNQAGDDDEDTSENKGEEGGDAAGDDDGDVDMENDADDDLKEGGGDNADDDDDANEDTDANDQAKSLQRVARGQQGLINETNDSDSDEDMANAADDEDAYVHI